ncbi:MAG TPA: hypothetical protein VFI22_14980 [Thermomicrobiales bacterium]|nr:hypothetical protein [Thermomicrobiales bacterium]
MPRLTYRRAEWRAIADELTAGRRPVPAGLLERVHVLLRQIPDAWQDQSATLELDASGADAVSAAHAALMARDPVTAQQVAAVAEAAAIVRDHQRRAE